MRRLLLILGATALLRAQDLAPAIPATELDGPPTQARVDLVVEAAARGGWRAWVDPLRTAAITVYRRDPAGAAPWFHLYRWSVLLATPEGDAIRQWMGAMQAAKLVHENLPRQYLTPPTPLGHRLSPELQKWALGHAAFSAEFFGTLSPLDQPAEVLAILQRLYAANPAVFTSYASLALAIAVVYDVPPPPDWPHGQVTAAVLPRRLPAPEAAFAYWTRLDRNGVCPLSLRRLPAAELKFVVDCAAPEADREWAVRNVALPLADFAHAYDLVPYRKERLAAQQFVWPGRDYRLATIRTTGGICIDQAYFAATAGKARGIPTLIFCGAGRDGRHAWFGYLSAAGWMLDAGRYAEQRFVVGVATDPQTWKVLNDHELSFLSERFHALPLYQMSVVNADFAHEFLAEGDPAAAVAAAREAVHREPHNLDGWETLALAQTRAHLPAAEIEGTLRSAAQAFQRYPDLEVSFSRMLVRSLRARGETSAATAEEERLVHKYQGDRSDLSDRTAADMLERSMDHDDFPAQVKTYDYVLSAYGAGAGIDFYDKVVERFVQHCRDLGQVPAALSALSHARKVLRIDPGGQLDREMKAAADTLAHAQP